MRTSTLLLALTSLTSFAAASPSEVWSITLGPKPTGTYGWGKPTHHPHTTTSEEDCDTETEEPETSTECEEETSTIYSTVTSTVPCPGPPCSVSTWTWSYTVGIPVSTTASTTKDIPTTPVISIGISTPVVTPTTPCLTCTTIPIVSSSVSKIWPNTTIVTSSKASPSVTLNGTTSTPTPKIVSGGARMELGSMAAALIALGVAMATL